MPHRVPQTRYLKQRYLHALHRFQERMVSPEPLLLARSLTVPLIQAFLNCSGLPGLSQANLMHLKSRHLDFCESVQASEYWELVSRCCSSTPTHTPSALMHILILTWQ